MSQSANGKPGAKPRNLTEAIAALHVKPDDFPGALDGQGGVRISSADARKVLQKENAELRAALEMYSFTSAEDWAEHAPQELRDQFAASALIAEGLHAQRALVRLGFKIEDSSERKRVAAEIFSAPGVQAILKDDAVKFAGKKSTVMNEMYAIVRTGTPDLKVRAAGQLSKMIDGWQDGEKNKNQPNVVNLLMQMVGGASANGARVIGNGAVTELPPGEEIIDAEAFFVDRGEEAVVVVDDAK